MKIRRLPAALALLLVTCLAATACGGSGGAARPSSAYAAPAPATAQTTTYETDMVAADVASGGGLNGTDTAVTPVMDSTRKIIRNAWLTLETKDFDQALSDLNALVAKSGGFIESQNASGRSIYSEGYYNRNASITARIPSDQLDAVINATEGICNIVSREISSQDISDTYFDSEAHLQSLTLQEERLLEILSKADKLEDIIELEKAITDVRYQIEALTASLRRMDQQVSYSTLQLELTEVSDYREPIAQPKSFGERVAASWERSMSHVRQTAEGLLLFAIEALPSMLLFLALPVCIILLVVRLLHKATRKRNPPLPPPVFKKSAPPTPPQPPIPTQPANPEDEKKS